MTSTTNVTKKKSHELQKMLKSRKQQFMQAMPKHINFDKFLRVVMTSIISNPKLLECDKGELMLKMMHCATLGLQPDGLNGEAYLIPFKNNRGNRMDCQMIIGYKGLVKLARQSGELTSINAFVVHENDELVLDAFQGCSYKPLLKGDRGAVIGFLGVALFKENEAYQYRYMSVEEVEKVRDESQGYISAKKYAKNGKINSPWTSHFNAMGEKTVIRRLCKLLPSSVELNNALHIESLQEAGKDYSFDDGIVSEKEMQDITPAEQNNSNSNNVDDLESKIILEKDVTDIYNEISEATTCDDLDSLLKKYELRDDLEGIKNAVEARKEHLEAQNLNDSPYGE